MIKNRLIMKNSDKLHKPVTSILRNPHFNSDGTVEGYSQFTPEVFEQEGFNHEQEHKKWEERTARQLSYHNNAKDKTKYKIPPITHSVYLTSDENPNPMKDLYVDNYGKTSQRLSTEDSSFVHYLWVNFDPNDPKYKDVIPEDIRSIPNLQISNIREFEGHPLYQNTVDFLENGRAASKFVEASDLVRVMAMEAKGGLYHDLDWKLYDAKEMIRYMKNFDFIGGREGEEPGDPLLPHGNNHAGAADCIDRAGQRGVSTRISLFLCSRLLMPLMFAVHCSCSGASGRCSGWLIIWSDQRRSEKRMHRVS